jgi:hypothetical protein
MSSTLAIQIGGFILFLIALAVSFRRGDRALKQREQAFKDQGAPRSLGLGTCLSGLPGLHQPELVSCGAMATELIFLADEDSREVGRIPWRSIVGIFGGDEREIYPHLATAKALPSLVLAQMPLRREDRKRRQPSYAVIEWNDGIAGRQQAVFEFPGAGLGFMKANYLKILQMASDQPLRKVPF